MTFTKRQPSRRPSTATMHFFCSTASDRVAPRPARADAVKAGRVSRHPGLYSIEHDGMLVASGRILSNRHRSSTAP